jgi:hypothetical protein
MGSKLLLKISAVIMFLNAVAHAVQHLQWKNAVDPVYGEVVTAMTQQKFALIGEVRTMGDYFNGYGYIITIFLLLIAALLWALADISEEYPNIGLKLLIPVVLFLVVNVINALIFFNVVAAVFSTVSTLICTMAIRKLYNTHLDAHHATVK